MEPLADAGALKIYVDKLKGKCLEDNGVGVFLNAFLLEHFPLERN